MTNEEGYALDTSAWLEIARGTASGRKLHEWYVAPGHRLYASVLVLAEITAKLPDEADALAQAIRGVATLIPVDDPIAVQGGLLRAQLRRADPGASLADGIHLATARAQGVPLVSDDAAFARQKDVVWMKRS